MTIKELYESVVHEFMKGHGCYELFTDDGHRVDKLKAIVKHRKVVIIKGKDSA
jgi:hypothetical protein